MGVFHSVMIRENPHSKTCSIRSSCYTRNPHQLSGGSVSFIQSRNLSRVFLSNSWCNPGTEWNTPGTHIEVSRA